MGRFPTLQNNEFYALMSAADGHFLTYDSSTKDFDIADPKPPSAGNDVAEYLFLLKTPLTSPHTITLEADDSEYVALDKPHNSIEAAGASAMDDDTKEQWVVSVGQSGIYQHFYTLKNAFHGTFLARDSFSGNIVGSDDNSHHRQQWQFVHVPKGVLPDEDYANINIAQQDFLNDIQDESNRKDEEQEQEQAEEQEQQAADQQEQAAEQEEQEEQDSLPGQGVQWGYTGSTPSVQERQFYNPDLSYTYDQQRENYFRLNPNASRYLP